MSPVGPWDSSAGGVWMVRSIVLAILRARVTLAQVCHDAHVV
jgi:hypothetical protein